MRSRTTAWYLGLPLSLMLILSACTSADDDFDAAPTVDATTEGRADAQPSRTTLEVPADAANLVTGNPLSEATGLGGTVYETLFMVDESNEIFSNIFESWQISEDARTVTLTLKPDIEWSDGTSMSSADVLMSLTQYSDPSIARLAARFSGIVGVDALADGSADSVSGLSAPDDLTVVIELEEPNAAWVANVAAIGQLFPVLPHHVLGDVPHDQLADHEFFKTHPVSSGPYKLVEHLPGQHTELEKNTNWSLGEPGFERVFLKELDYDAQIAQLETGELQIVTNVASIDAERLRSISGTEVQSVPGSWPLAWGLRQYEPLEDPRVRQAMIFAIDREGICQAVFQGFCSVPLTNVRQIGPEWAIPTDDMIEYRYDPDRARELLDEAGWDPTTQLTLLDCSCAPPAWREGLDIAQANLAEVGINWTIETVDLPGLTEAWEGGAEALQGFSIAGGDFTVDPSVMETYTSCDQTYPNGGNTTHYCDPELDELWAAGRRETDQNERADIYHEAFRRLNRNPAEIFLNVPDVIAAHDSRLKGVKVNAARPIHWNIGEWYWED